MLKEQTQVPNGTGRGARRSKRPLFAIQISCKCSMKTFFVSGKRSKSVIKSRR